MACTKSIDVMLSKPGMYVLLCQGGAAFVVEVDSKHNCYQCTLDDHRRDGVLPSDGWIPSAIAGILGPFARVT